MEQLEPINESIAEPVIEATPIACRRCRNLFDPGSPACPFCGAVNREAKAAGARTADAVSVVTSDQALMAVCTWYALILGVDVLFGLAMSFSRVEWSDWYLFAVLSNDAIFVTATIIAWWKTRSLPKTLDRVLPRAASWALALPMLALALGVNMVYHLALNRLGQIPVGQDFDELLGSMAAVIMLICVEPALFEELFFRGVAWKALRHHMGPHATILVTSAMFGMAHIGVPLSVPALFFVGVVLGYVRLWSGGLVLPMTLHFLHNLYVVLSPEF